MRAATLIQSGPQISTQDFVVMIAVLISGLAAASIAQPLLWYLTPAVVVCLLLASREGALRAEGSDMPEELNAKLATTLNGLNGASMPAEVLSAWNEGTTLFSTYTPAQIGAQKGSQQPRKRFLELAGLLDMYNNGLIGPGHCSE